MDSKRFFTCSEGNSNKFWWIKSDANKVSIGWGRIGTDGQTKIHFFPDNDLAAEFVHKKIAEKTKKGYRES